MSTSTLTSSTPKFKTASKKSGAPRLVTWGTEHAKDAEVLDKKGRESNDTEMCKHAERAYLSAVYCFRTAIELEIKGSKKKAELEGKINTYLARANFLRMQDKTIVIDLQSKEGKTKDESKTNDQVVSTGDGRDALRGLAGSSAPTTEDKIANYSQNSVVLSDHSSITSSMKTPKTHFKTKTSSSKAKKQEEVQKADSESKQTKSVSTTSNTKMETPKTQTPYNSSIGKQRTATSDGKTNKTLPKQEASVSSSKTNETAPKQRTDSKQQASSGGKNQTSMSSKASGNSDPKKGNFRVAVKEGSNKKGGGRRKSDVRIVIDIGREADDSTSTSKTKKVFNIWPFGSSQAPSSKKTKASS